MDRRLIIVGASGHGKVVADIAAKNGYDSIIFLDGDEAKQRCGGYPVAGREELLDRIGGDVVIAIGSAEIRRKLQEAVDGGRLATLVHPDAVIAGDVEIGAGTVVMAGAVVNPGTVIGKGCIINTCASVDHDCAISDYVHVSVGAHVAGTVSIGGGTWVGAGAVISNNLRIRGGCMIGAGAVVVKNIDASGTYVGVPAARVR